MKRATREWVDKVEGYYAVAGRELAAPSPVFDAVCFHAQQSVEKYLKAFLQERGIDYPRTHDLVDLAARAGAATPDLVPFRAELALLTAFAVAPRYPGTSTDRADAEAAIGAAGRVRGVLRLALDR